MNWRLLTDEEKRFNGVARQQRKDQQKAIRRRQLALGAIRDPLLLLDEAVLPASKICETFWQKDLRPVKRAIREMTYLHAAANFVAPAKPTSRPVHRAVPRPSRVLWPQKRGTIPRKFPPPRAPLGEFLGADKAIKMAAERVDEGDDVESILHFLADPQATGLGVAACAELLQRLGLVRGKDAASAAKLVEEAEAFHAVLADGRALFNTMVANGGIEPAQGDWISISRPALLRLLPGLQLPKEFRHEQFLANVIADQEGRPECLDIHAITFRGLCRHPLRVTSRAL